MKDKLNACSKHISNTLTCTPHHVHQFQNCYQEKYEITGPLSEDTCGEDTSECQRVSFAISGGCNFPISMVLLKGALCTLTRETFPLSK